MVQKILFKKIYKVFVSASICEHVPSEKNISGIRIKEPRPGEIESLGGRDEDCAVKRRSVWGKHSTVEGSRRDPKLWFG